MQPPRSIIKWFNEFSVRILSRLLITCGIANVINEVVANTLGSKVSAVAPATIELETHDAESLLRMSEIKKFSDASGYAYQLEIASRGFCAARPFYFEQFYLSRCIDALKQMSSGVPGIAVLRSEFESDYFRLQSNDLGHVVVDGELHEHSALAQTLRFSFRTDQTVLAPLADSLAQWLVA